MSTADPSTETTKTKINWQWLLPAVLIFAAILYAYREGLGLMVNWWEKKEEYNHGYLIPVVAAYLLLLQADRFRNTDIQGAWSGIWVVLFGVVLLVLGELSSVYVITQYSFLVTLVGVLVIAIGWRGIKVVWAPVFYLFFMIPLPSFLYNNLSAELQMLSSDFGVAVLRLAGVSVFLEGNVIDLGEFQLQVAEACSGLRYLFPLTSFGFLCAYLFRGPLWQKIFIFASTIPITLFMNSFRIGVIGILVEYYGIAMARGFLHDFEGWIVFMACVGLLFAEMWLFAKLSKRRFIDVFAVDVPPMRDFLAFLPRQRPSPAVFGLVVLFAGVAVLNSTFQAREEIIPERDQLSTFPLLVDEWRGVEMGIEQVYLDELKLDDYLMARYGRKMDRLPIELYVAYYDSQRKGASVHSPRACLPGGGWTIESFEEHRVENVGPDGEPVQVNRALISLGEDRQLVYYWFQQRGRNLTNEYLVKWFIFWDSLTKNRSDGALVRLVTPIPDGYDIGEADERMAEFVRKVDPMLSYYIPRDIES
ncbi:MAG: VPLPA-CTERM-specific exosortase XrtD [Gammaproteobacteria bacterium]|nr:VPLPA-CTERM-specific exosortase XrtD [Gammaproteobacteria bacterium]